MKSIVAKSLLTALLAGLDGAAAASSPPPAIDLFHAAGVPGSGGYSTLMGPCYCEQTLYASPIMLLQPGTYDFGHLRQYWAISGFTPDGGPDQPYLWLLFSPLEVAGQFPFSFPGLASYAFPATGECDQHDDACNAGYANAYRDIDLVYTVAPGQNALQVGLIGHYQYISPLPEPRMLAMCLLGLALLAPAARAAAKPGSPRRVA